MKPRYLKLMLNLYPPLLGTGIRVKRISRDFREIDVRMKLRWYNRNYVNSHFGGSLYAMTDPFYMLMLIQILGKQFIVWDKAARIKFIKPGRGTVTAKFVIDDEKIKTILDNTSNGEKYLPQYLVDIVDEEGEIIAQVVKTLYIKKKE